MANKADKRFKAKTAKTRPKPVARRRLTAPSPTTLPPAVPIADNRRMDA